MSILLMSINSQALCSLCYWTNLRPCHYQTENLLHSIGLLPCSTDSLVQYVMLRVHWPYARSIACCPKQDPGPDLQCHYWPRTIETALFGQPDPNHSILSYFKTLQVQLCPLSTTLYQLQCYFPLDMTPDSWTIFSISISLSTWPFVPY